MIHVSQGLWHSSNGWVKSLATEHNYDLLLVFGPVEQLKSDSLFLQLSEIYPQSLVFGCSTAGQISGLEIQEEPVVITGLKFESSHLRLVHTGHDQHPSIFAAGKFLAEQLSQPDLVHVLVLADGILINGSELTSGFNAHLPGSVSLSGGLAADNAAFTETVVCTAEGAASKQIIALGLYGSNLEVACGTGGGWEPFGPERVVTRSVDNELFEMDHRSALELYRLYLGEFATGLPATGLSFPLEIRIPGKPPLVRTVQAINHESGSLIFAGDVPEGAIARLMKTNLDHLLDGAAHATDLAAQQLSGSADLALIISCLGRKMVLKQRCEEELEEVYQRLQIPAPLTGFYSNGEMAPNIDYKYCNFHNQTLTITLLREASD